MSGVIKIYFPFVFKRLAVCLGLYLEFSPAITLGAPPVTPLFSVGTKGNQMRLQEVTRVSAIFIGSGAVQAAPEEKTHPQPRRSNPSAVQRQCRCVPVQNPERISGTCSTCRDGRLLGDLVGERETLKGRAGSAHRGSPQRRALGRLSKQT